MRQPKIESEGEQWMGSSSTRRTEVLENLWKEGIQIGERDRANDDIYWGSVKSSDDGEDRK